MSPAATSTTREAARRRGAQRRGGVAGAAVWLVGLAVVVAARPSPPSAAAVVMATTAAALWLRRDRGAGRWEAGAAGERATAQALAGLGRRWVVVHDVRFDHTRANVDHVAIGPRGCVVIDSKQWLGSVGVGRRTLRIDGTSATGLLDQQVWSAGLVAAVAAESLGRPVDAVAMLAVHGAAIRRGVWRRRRAGETWVAPGGDAHRWAARAGRRLRTSPRLSRHERVQVAAALASRGR